MEDGLVQILQPINCYSGTIKWNVPINGAIVLTFLNPVLFHLNQNSYGKNSTNSSIGIDKTSNRSKNFISTTFNQLCLTVETYKSNIEINIANTNFNEIINREIKYLKKFKTRNEIKNTNLQNFNEFYSDFYKGKDSISNSHKNSFLFLDSTNSSAEKCISFNNSSNLLNISTIKPSIDLSIESFSTKDNSFASKLNIKYEWWNGRRQFVEHISHSNRLEDFQTGSTEIGKISQSFYQDCSPCNEDELAEMACSSPYVSIGSLYRVEETNHESISIIKLKVIKRIRPEFISLSSKIKCHLKKSYLVKNKFKRNFVRNLYSMENSKKTLFNNFELNLRLNNYNKPNSLKSLNNYASNINKIYFKYNSKLEFKKNFTSKKFNNEYKSTTNQKEKLDNHLKINTNLTKTHERQICREFDIIYINKNCGIKSGPGKFIIFAKYLLGKLRLTCGPSLVEFKQTWKKLERENRTFCLINIE